MSKKLRQGFTTGTAAAAAAKAGVIFLCTGEMPASVSVHTPGGEILAIPIAGYTEESGRVRVTVVKDAGDDPDVTHGARIQGVVCFDPASPGQISIDGGRGVGRVTKPGLPCPVGGPAINPAPREQIGRAVKSVLDEYGGANGVAVVVEVPDGEKLAERTLNPRLGVVGGISILGTRGTVKPFSHEAYEKTIELCLNRLKDEGETRAAFCTGGRSERLLREKLDAWPDQCFITVADFFAASMSMAAEAGMKTIAWGVFFGKLAKHAQGLENTHAHSGDLRFGVLSSLWLQTGGDKALAEKIAQANTAMQVLDMIKTPGVEPGSREKFFSALTGKALGNAANFVGKARRIELAYYLFDMDGTELYHSRKGRGK